MKAFLSPFQLRGKKKGVFRKILKSNFSTRKFHVIDNGTCFLMCAQILQLFLFTLGMSKLKINKFLLL